MSEPNLREYKLGGGHFEEALVQHHGSGCNFYFIRDVEDAQELMDIIKEHHERLHNNG